MLVKDCVPIGSGLESLNSVWTPFSHIPEKAAPSGQIIRPKPVLHTIKQSWARDNVLASRQRQRNNVIEPQGSEKFRQIFRSRCLEGVATTNIVILQFTKTLWPENMLTLSQQYCCVPSSDYQGLSCNSSYLGGKNCGMA